MTITKKLEIANKRFKEMEGRKECFLEKYRNTGDRLFLELANDEQRQMDELMEAILKAKKKVLNDDLLWFKRDYIAELLGFEDFDELMNSTRR